MTSALVKVALRRDPTYPLGQPAPLVLWCPCGEVLPVVGTDAYLIGTRCPSCGRTFSHDGYIQAETLQERNNREIPTTSSQRWHASREPISELKRHASVCTDNRCPCLTEGPSGAFTCACLAVLTARRARGEAL